MIRKVIKSDNYIPYLPQSHTLNITKLLHSNYNQERDEELEFYKKIDNSISLSELCRGLGFYKSLTEKDKELFSVSTYQLSYLIGEDTQTIDYMGMTSLSLAKSKVLKPNFVFDLTHLNSLSSSLSKNFIKDFVLLFSEDLDELLNFQSMLSILSHNSLVKDYFDTKSNFIEYDKTLSAKYNQIFDIDYAIQKTINKILTFPTFQRGLDFELPLNHYPLFTSTISETTKNTLIEKELELLSHLILNSKTLNEEYNQETLQRLLEISKIDKTISFSQLERGLDFSLSLIEKDILNYDFDLLFDKELDENYNQIVAQDYFKIFKMNDYETFEIDSRFLSSLSLTLNESYALEYIAGAILFSLGKTLKPIFEIQSNLLSPFSCISNDSYVIDYIQMGILSLTKNKTFKPLFEFQLDVLNEKIIDTKINIDQLQRGLEFSISNTNTFNSNILSSIEYSNILNQSLDYQSIFYLLSLISQTLGDSYVLEYIIPNVLSLTKRKTFKPLFEIQSKYLASDIFDTKINISRFQRGLEFSLDSTNSFISSILSNIEFIDILCQLSNYQSIYDLLSPSYLELIPTITIPVALTTLSFAKTKLFSPSISFDNYFSSIENLTSSPHFRLDVESFLTSTISFDDIYSIWKVISLSFSKNLNFEYKQTQDFEIDLKIAQLLSKIITISPSVEAIRVALKEILTFAKQIEVLAFSKQITVTTTIKQIPISVSSHMA